MALKVEPALGKFLYGALFLVALPLALAWWARGAGVNVSLPAPEIPLWGTALAVAGALLWLSGVLALRIRGGGLPMNAYPPPRLVATGVYALTAHPIYLGFVLAAFGTALARGSAAGQWLVSPVPRR